MALSAPGHLVEGVCLSERAREAARWELLQEKTGSEGKGRRREERGRRLQAVVDKFGQGASEYDFLLTDG